MIKINLLKPLQAPVAPLILEEPKNKRRTMILVGGLALVAAAAIVFLQYPTLLGGSGEETRVAASAAPPTGDGRTPEPGKRASIPKPKRVTADAVEEIVREIQEEQGRQGPVATYADLVPSEKIEYQYFAATRILKDIKAVTPPDIGFAHFIFSPPGDFYIHGLAYDEATYQRFQDGLAGLEGASIRPGVTARGGSRGAGGRSATLEFSFYGTVKYPVNAIPQPPDRVLKQPQLQAELKRLKEVAASLGIALRSPKLKSTSDAGEYRKMVFQASADCSYQQMQDLLSELHESKSNLGFLKFALKASGDENVTASLDILAYVN
jgi:hypothetical protein